MTNQPYDIAATLSVAEAATLLGCSGQTVRERIKRGELGGVLVRTATGKAWRVVRSGALAPPQLHTCANEAPDQEVRTNSALSASLAQVQPGVVEALGLLRDSLEQLSALREENARLREQLAARPLALAAPALGFWLALWTRLSAGLAAGRAG